MAKQRSGGRRAAQAQVLSITAQPLNGGRNIRYVEGGKSYHFDTSSQEFFDFTNERDCWDLVENFAKTYPEALWAEVLVARDSLIDLQRRIAALNFDDLVTEDNEETVDA